MNYKIPQIIDLKWNFKRLLKSLIFFVAPFLFLLFFYNQPVKSLKACSTIVSPNTANPGVNCVIPNSCSAIVAPDVPNPGVNCLNDCSTLSDSTVPNPGGNCLYLSLPPCSYITSNGGTVNHRVNCADVTDLTVCDDMPLSVTAKPSKNCVSKCTENTQSSGCIKFCDELPSGISAISGTNCTPRKCHQLSAADNPDATSATPNCTMMNCNLLTAYELNNTKFNQDTKKYCESGSITAAGDTRIKCLLFSQDKLPFVKIRNNNPTCYIHDCSSGNPPLTSSYCTTRDIANITSKGSDYVTAYKAAVIGNADLNAVCRQLSCKPIVQRYLSCTSDIDGNITVTGTTETCDVFINNISSTRNSNNTVTTAITRVRQTCNNGFCIKTIDCNAPLNKSPNAIPPECVLETDAKESNNYLDDQVQSWFYRPRPPAKSLSDDNPTLYKEMDNNGGQMCYHDNQLKNNGEGVNLSIFGFYLDYVSYDTVSPPSCNTPDYGPTGVGYVNLCGNKGDLYQKPSDETAYYKGYVATSYNGSVATHEVRVCTRFKTTSIANVAWNEACGTRECGVICNFGRCTSQACGGDVCRTLKVKSNNPRECEMNFDFSNGTPNSDCVARLGGGASANSYIRLRAVQYSNNLCVFMDSLGQFAYQTNFFNNGSEALADGTCVSGTTKNENNVCQGYSSNSSPGSAQKWRTIKFSTPGGNIPYSMNVLPATSDLRGYFTQDAFDANGNFVSSDGKTRFFKAMDCAKVPLKTAPPSLYNVANSVNSYRLFTPPIYIKTVSLRRDSSVSLPAVGNGFGETDFDFPEVEVQFGFSSAKLSLGIGYTGNELTTNAQDSRSYTTLTPDGTGVGYSAEVFIKKEVDANNGPLVCLYRKVKDADGQYVSPVKLQCANRKYPSINSATESTVSSTTTTVPILNKAIVSADKSNQTNINSYITTGNRSTNATQDSPPQLAINLQYLSGTNLSSSATCPASGSNATSTTNTAQCTSPLKITTTDADNEFCVNAASAAEYYKVCARREKCSKLFVECARNQIQIANAALQNQNILEYDVINNDCEALRSVCADKFVATFNSFNVTSNDTTNTVYPFVNELCISSGFENKLKWVFAYSPVNSTSLGKCIVTPDAAARCPNGGSAPDCPCTIASGPDVTAPDGQVVRQQTAREAGLCITLPELKHCAPINYGTDQGLTSLGVLSPNNIANSHINRTTGTTVLASTSPVHAEFNSAYTGTTVIGSCNEFWKNTQTRPTLTCLLNSDGDPVWSAPNSGVNDCVRYTCPAITTTGPAQNSYDYDNNYSAGETTDDTRGQRNGFAIWDSYTNTNDYATNVAAARCIDGFAPTGGSLPTRVCNQQGGWGSVISNPCQRKSCPAITAADESSGGATFPQTVASRRSVEEPAYVTSAPWIATGTCVGNYKTPLNGQNPSRECLSSGLWSSNVRNRCLTSCVAIAKNSPESYGNNGNAAWEAKTTDTGNGQLSQATSCNDKNASGQDVRYVPYPYPSNRNRDGSIITNPTQYDVNTPAITTPAERACVNGIWAVPMRPCVSTCPGADTDSRINIGVTQHQTSSGQVNVRWNAAPLGSTQYYSSVSDIVLSASDFRKDRTNGYFVLSRTCGTNGKWGVPQPVCVANGGQIGHATFAVSGVSISTDNPTVANANSVEAGGNSFVDGTCSPTGQYWTHNRGADPVPQMQCVYKAGNKIDEVYFNMVDGKSDCEQVTCEPSIQYGAIHSDGDPRVGYTQIPAGTLGDKVTLQCLQSFTYPDFDSNGANLRAIADAMLQSTLSGTGTILPTTNSSGGVAQATCTYNAGTATNPATATWAVESSACKKSCRLAEITGDTQCLNNKGGGSGTIFSLGSDAAFAKHGVEISYVFSDWDEGWGCDKYMRSFKCNDGVWVDSGAQTYYERDADWNGISCPDGFNSSYIYNWSLAAPVWNDYSQGVREGASCTVKDGSSISYRGVDTGGASHAASSSSCPVSDGYNMHNFNVNSGGVSSGRC